MHTKHCTTIFSLLSMLLIYAANAQAETYIYLESDGTRWLTDRPMDPRQFTFINKYGRPTASQSCKNVTHRVLENRARVYMPMVRHFAQQHQIDTALIKAIIAVESCFDSHAISRAGAHGLMQLMPATAAQYGVLDRFDAKQNLRAGIEHLRHLLDHFNDNLQYSLAAYNAGTRNVEKYQGIPPFKETQGYVKKVLQYYAQYRQQHIQSQNHF